MDADELFVEGDVDGAFATDASHRVGLSGADGLLDAVDGVGGKLIEFAEGFVGAEGAVGVEAEFDIGG